RARQRIEPDAVQALVEATGAELHELASATDQLLSDTTGTVTAETVRQCYGGRVQPTGFAVADAAIAGNPAEAVALTRHAVDAGTDGDAGEAGALLRRAVATGTGPVPDVAALALKLRTMAKVAATRGRSGVSVGEFGLAPWQVDRARRELGSWSPEGLPDAITAVAAADAEVKGQGRDPVFAVERAVLRIAAARGR